MEIILVLFQALSVGIFPYVLKLLQSSAKELRPLLVFIWAKILAVDNVRLYNLAVIIWPSISCHLLIILMLNVADLSG